MLALLTEGHKHLEKGSQPPKAIIHSKLPAAQARGYNPKSKLPFTTSLKTDLQQQRINQLSFLILFLGIPQFVAIPKSCFQDSLSQS